ncbi:MAG: hypothetical protein IKO56_08830 [Alphaproteobacteria bacterium]|nr:hypothetical protein [Alphaproteobacteria bacterium]
MQENVNNQKPTYKAPVVYGVKESEVTAMKGGRWQGGNTCCFCTGHGTSRG